MPRARAAAAATGLPEDTTDFHLSIGRRIGKIRAELARAEANEQEMSRRDEPGVSHIKTAIEHLCDRDETLVRALASLPADTLAGATVQVAAAMKLMSWMAIFDCRRADDERAIKRLLDSAIAVLIDAAGLDPIQDGIAELAEVGLSAWRDPHETISQFIPDGEDGVD